MNRTGPTRTRGTDETRTCGENSAVLVLLAVVTLTGPAAGTRRPAFPRRHARRGDLRDPGHLNPAITTSGATHTAAELLYNGLLGRDERGDPVPELAESWAGRASGGGLSLPAAGQGHMA